MHHRTIYTKVKITLRPTGNGRFFLFPASPEGWQIMAGHINRAPASPEGWQIMADFLGFPIPWQVVQLQDYINRAPASPEGWQIM